MTSNLAGKSNALTFVVVYVPVGTPQSREERDVFWTELDTVDRIPSKHHLLILMDAGARIRIRTREEERKIMGTYGRDSRSNGSNGISLLQFVGENRHCPDQQILFHPKRSTSRCCQSPSEQGAYRLHAHSARSLQTFSQCHRPSLTPQLAGF